MGVNRPLWVLYQVVGVSRPSMRLIIALGLTTRLTSREIVASGLGCDVNTLGKGREKRYALLLRMANRGIAVVFGVGVDIVILGVDIEILCRYIDPRCRHSNPRCGHIDPRCRHNDPRCRHSGPEEAEGKTKKWEGGLRGREEGVVSRVRRLEAGLSVLESVDTRSHKGHGAPCYMPIPGI